MAVVGEEGGSELRASVVRDRVLGARVEGAEVEGAGAAMVFFIDPSFKELVWLKI